MNALLAIYLATAFSCAEKPEVAPKPRLVDPVVKAFVAHLAKNGITLEPRPDGSWVVTDPKEDGFEVAVHFRTFPATATETEMRATLKGINLAFDLNPVARLAMSLPYLRATGPKMIPARTDQVPTVAMLKTHFNTYAPPAPKR